MNFMLFVECDPNKDIVPEVFGVKPETLEMFFKKVIKRWNKSIENDRHTKIFLDVLNEMPEEEKSGIIMTLAVVQMIDHIKMMSLMKSMSSIGEMLKKQFEEHE